MDRARIDCRQHVRAEDAPLLDRLRSTNAVQLGWPVGGGDDQRHPVEVGLDHAGKQFGDGGARGHQDQDRPTGGAGQAEGHEACRALVAPDVHPQPAGSDGQGQRRRTRARRDHGISDAATLELVDEGGAER